MAEESDLERTEPASSRRIEKAREEGQVPQSRELMAFLVMASGAGGLWALGDWFARRAGDIVKGGLSFGHDAAFDPGALSSSFADLSWQALMLVAPMFLLTVVAALATPFLIGGWVFSPKALAADFNRIDPLKGVKRMFSMNSVGELVKALLKALLIGGIIWWVVRHEQDNLFALIGQPIETALPAFGRMLLFAFLGLVAGLALIAAIDVPFQLWQYYRRLRMTREELRQEMKEMEGDPQLKARIRSQQREIARRRMMAEVPKADVVVTNPTHFAVALKYDSGSMGAPQVVAKGMNLVARKIRDLAGEHGVPVLEAPPLARALYRHTDIGSQIPGALYTAVAEVMAYVYQLNQFIAAGGSQPRPPTAIAVPEGMDPGVPEAAA
ncbi:MAG: flagellar biosynthesis protein FlhB [Candidatus Nitricoxidivorans perseverans]|uniref:Flagellar biosynthetic protein FlhB n=1 Tax=Candidatus Nitricoxidivorans perseverans TaxID=2975601 RepID=A0AA49FMY0_9PROT|nr:MAG: flagellar biosynthesis protein FlhB [Candidatus Nitricoxidivorans perseverans]